MPCWSIYFHKVHYKNWVPGKGFWQSGIRVLEVAGETTQEEALHQDKHSIQHPRPQRRLQTLFKLLDKTFHGYSLSKTSPDNTAKGYKCGARSEHIWLHLLPPKRCTVLLQAASHYTRAHFTHKGQLICSNHSTECRLCMVKIAFPFFGQF